MEQTIRELFNFGVKDFTFTNLPKRIDISAYEAVQSEFIGYYAKVKGVMAIYKYGEISVPGLSDLDFIVILDDEYKHQYGTRYDKHLFSGQAQYILTHSQLFLSKSLLKQIQLVMNIGNLKKMWGEDILIEKYSQKENKLSNIFKQLDSFITRFPKLFFTALLTKKINVRNIIARLNALRYLVKMYEEINHSQNEELNNYIKEIREFKSSWFENSQEDNLKSLILYLKRALKINYYLIEDLNKLLALDRDYNMQMERLKEDIVSFKSGGYITHFIRHWEPMASVNKTFEIFKQTNEYVQILPLNFSLHLLYYASSAGKFGNFIKNQFMPMPELYMGDNNLPARKHSELINDYFDFLENKNINGSISLNNFFGYRPVIRRLPFEHRFSNYKRRLIEKIACLQTVRNLR